MPTNEQGLGHAIVEMWAWVSVHGDNDEGLVAASINGMLLPLVGADEARTRSLRPFAEQAAAESGLPVRLKRFTTMTVVESIVR